MLEINSYYTKNNKLFRNDLDERLQLDSQTANALGTRLLTQNAKAYKFSRNEWKTSNNVVINLPDPLFDPWFWTAVILIDHHSWTPHGGGGCSGGSGCGGSGNSGGCKVDGGACIAVLLIIAIAALIIAIIALIGLAGKEGYDADQIRQEINEIKKEKSKLQNESEGAKQVYEAMLPILREQYKSKVAETLCTVTILVGVSFLTASAIVALYSVLNNIPMSPLAAPFAITGAGVAVAGLLGHAIRPLTRLILEKQRMKQYQKLHEALQECRKSVANPFDILQQQEEGNVYLKLGGQLFLKNGKNFLTELEHNYKRDGYTEITIENR